MTVRPRVVLATRNPGKLVELRRILDGVVAVDLVGLDEVTPYEPAPETGATFEANALAKAREAARITGLPAVADDSGLSVDALNGMPGVLSARWAGRHGDDLANLELLLAQVADVPAERRAAGFVCAAAWATPAGQEGVVRGELRGRLLREPRGTGGFGYDPVLQPDGETRSTAQMSPQEKDAISHRGLAFRALAPHLAAALGHQGPCPESYPPVPDGCQHGQCDRNADS